MISIIIISLSLIRLTEGEDTSWQEREKGNMTFSRLRRHYAPSDSDGACREWHNFFFLPEYMVKKPHHVAGITRLPVQLY